MTDVVPPEPLTLLEVKKNLRVSLVSTAEDDLLAGLIVAARAHVESVTGLVLTPRTITETAPSFGRWIDLASWPVTSVSAVRYSADGNMVALPDASWTYSAKRRPVRLLPTAVGWGIGWLGCAGAQLPVEIDVVAGYATPADVPQPIKQAMQLLVAHWWGNRAAVEVGARAQAIEVPLGVDALLRPYRLAVV